MDARSTVILGQRSENLVLHPVKNIEFEAENVEVDNKLLLRTSSQGLQNEQELLESSDNVYEESEIFQNLENFCRVCANTNNVMIPIFHGEGVQRDLSKKIDKYLPIQVSENDTLPAQLCYNCVSLILAWDELSQGCLDAQQKLFQIHVTIQAKQSEKSVDQISEGDEEEEIEKHDVILTESEANDIQSIDEGQDGTAENKHDISNLTNTQRSRNFQAAIKSFETQNNCQKSRRPSQNNEESHGSWIDNTLNFFENNISNEQNMNQNDFLHRDNRSEIRAKCKICSMGFVDVNTLHWHVKIHKIENPGDERDAYQCAECKKCFRLKDSLRRHMRIHVDERLYTCHICGKQFRDSGGLCRHVNSVHGKVRNFSCDICGSRFASNATRNDHRRTHTGERPFECDNCGKKFKSKACLYIHSKLHTDNFPHVCLMCNKKFRRKQELLCHVTTHTGEKNFNCDKCSKRFRVKSELARHLRSHSEERPYVCNNCGMRFRQGRYLNNHLKNRHQCNPNKHHDS